MPASFARMEWPVDIKEARKVQLELAARVRCVPLRSPLRTAAGFRIPEPLRRADRLSRAASKSAS